MRAWTVRHWGGLVGVSAVGWLAVACVCLLAGSTGVGVPTAAQLGSRLEVVVLASIVGAALAGAGVTYQCVLRNPLADPYLLGVASGASLGTMLWRFPATLAGFGGVVAAVGQPVMALIGALVASGLVLVVAGGGGGRTGRGGTSYGAGRLEPVTLILVGVIVSSVCSAVVLLLLSLRPEILAGGGGLSGVMIGALQTNLSVLQMVLAAGVLLVGLLAMTLLAPSLAVSTLSDAEAAALGLRIVRLRWLALGVAGVVVAGAVAVSGPIGFVGLVCPHLGRLLVGPDPRRLLPVATALGAGLLCLADGLCRLLAMQQLVATLLPVGVVTALLGGPFFLVLLLRYLRGGTGDVGGLGGGR